MAEKTEKSERKARLAAELRANLKRRKAKLRDGDQPETDRENAAGPAGVRNR